MTLKRGESPLYYMTVAEVIDRYTIALIKRERGITARITESERKLAEEHYPLTLRLRAINEAIWWCMNKQRNYSLGIAERGMIGIIAAFLNDLRDEVKQEIQQAAWGEDDGKHYQ